jgi:3-methyladenine DNA glycosylase AlkC
MKFDELCEGFGVIKQTKRILYPKQIQLSEEFLQALRNEYYRMKLEEDLEQPVKDRPQKFLKALQFHLTSLEENATQELEAYKRIMDENTEEYIAKSEKDDEYPKKGKDHKKEQKRRAQIPKENMSNS